MSSINLLQVLKNKIPVTQPELTIDQYDKLYNLIYSLRAEICEAKITLDNEICISKLFDDGDNFDIDSIRRLCHIVFHDVIREGYYLRIFDIYRHAEEGFMICISNKPLQ